MDKYSQLEAKHKSLIQFVNKTLKLFQSYIEYNQQMSWEIQQLKQLSKSFELDLAAEEPIGNCQPNDDEENDDPVNTTEKHFESINMQIMMDEWGEQVADTTTTEQYYDYEEDTYHEEPYEGNLIANCDIYGLGINSISKYC